MKNFLIKLFFLNFIFFKFISAANAQITQFPLPGKYIETKNIIPERKTKPLKSAYKVSSIPLNLPFFDDFSTTFGQPNPNLWINSGAQVGNHTGVDTPSKGVAQMDGAKYSGVPYNVKNQLAQGPTDTLTSQNIDLSSYLPQDSIALVFFYQARGLGEQPDKSEGDSLLVEFKTSDTTFTKVWAKGGDALGPFKKGNTIINGFKIF